MTFADGTLAVAICDRCRLKYPYKDLSADRQSPGLRVCPDCNDEKDPYRRSPRRPDALVLRYPRPDVDLSTNPPIAVSDTKDQPVVLDDGKTELTP